MHKKCKKGTFCAYIQIDTGIALVLTDFEVSRGEVSGGLDSIFLVHTAFLSGNHLNNASAKSSIDRLVAACAAHESNAIGSRI